MNRKNSTAGSEHSQGFTLSETLTIIVILIFVIFGFNGCSGCSRSGAGSRSAERPETVPPVTEEMESPGSNTLRMEKRDGVYHIPVAINGIPMEFIFDTGAGLISISAAEAGLLYRQGTLTSADIIGTAGFIDANGDVTEGTIINLREVKIGSKVLHDVKASVADNLSAPLLIGQSALEKFGRISIDYQKNEITFE